MKNLNIVAGPVKDQELLECVLIKLDLHTFAAN